MNCRITAETRVRSDLPTTAATSRRDFLKTAAAIGASGFLTPRFLSAQGRGSAGERLNLAFIGAGGRAGANLSGLKGQNVVALCDVDDARAATAFEQHSKARRFRDFRKMLDEMDRQIDAVVVSTPDHTHAVAAIDAMRRGKHVYCEKPLAHSVAEIRAMQRAAREHGVVTQMGNQGHSFDHIRLFCEWIWAGAIGNVHTIHAFRDSNYSRIDRLPSLSEKHPVPHTLDWQLWLGPVAERPYHPAYLPGIWRGWMPFGTGVIGDWVCHIVDPVFWALDLGAPKSILAEAPGYDPKAHAETFPAGAHVTYKFAAKGSRAPVTLHWYDGSFAPLRPEGWEGDWPGRNTCAVVLGDKGSIRYGSHGATGVRIFPEEKMAEFKRPEPSLPRVKDHYDDWLQAIRSGGQAGSNFDYGGSLAEIALLGVIAIRMLGTELEWDGEAMKFTNCDEANPLLTPQFRAGWTL